MHCGIRVFLHSLATAVELNQKFGQIVTVEREKVVVKMEGMERTVRVSKNKVAATWRDLETAPKAATEREIAPMDWGTTDSRRYFYARWRQEIKTMDGGAFEQSGSNIYKYLIAKLTRVLYTKRQIGYSKDHNHY